MTNLIRCSWGETDDKLVQTYHDQEWGKLNLDEHYLYEMLTLETFQSGLSWNTILHKRENFRTAFANFEVEKVAKFDEGKFEALMGDAGIIRNKLKIRAAINNAQLLVKWHTEDKSFANYLTSFIAQPIDNHLPKETDLPASTLLSLKISKDMKK